MIFPFLKKYRRLYDVRKYMSYPADFAPDPLKPEGPDNPDRYQDWLASLDKMIYAFEWIAKHGDWDGPEVKEYHKECSRVLKPHKKELKRLAQEDEKRGKEFKGPCGRELLEWNRSFEITRPITQAYVKKFEEHQKKIQEGIDLFAKYFGSLWL